MNSIALTSLAPGYAWSIAQVTLVAAAALVVYSLARRQSSHQSVLLLTASLAIAAMLTLSFVSPWPNWNFADQSTRRWFAAESADFRVSHFEQRTTTTLPLNPTDSRTTKESITATAPVLVPIERERSNATTPAAPSSWLPVAVAAFALLAVIGIARFIVGLWAVERHRRSSVPIEDTEVEREFNSLVRQFKITRPVTLRVAHSLTIPATIGWRKPLVLVPESFSDWTADERRVVLAHELAHVAERHYPLWLIGQFAVAANFYHPLVHWLCRRLRLEQELAADALAIEVFADRRAYANILAGLALAPSRSHTTTASLGLYMSRPLVMRRIAMLRQTAPAPRRSRLTSSLAALVLLAAATCAVGLRATAPAAASDETTFTVHDQPTADKPFQTIPDSAPQTIFDTEVITPPGLQIQSVVALLQVSRNPAKIMADNTDRLSDNEWKIYCETQIAYLYSYVVAQAALRDPTVKDLPLIVAQKDPTAWLINNLRVGFIPSSEILSIEMRGKPSEVNQLRLLVDAVANAYLKEVVFASDQERNVVRDALRNSYAKLSEEIVGKMEEQQALAEELGAADLDGKSRILQDLDVKRLDRVETELLRLEDEQLSAQTYADELGANVQPKESAKLKFYNQRIADLKKRQAELEQRIIERNRSSVELTTLSQELKQLQAIASEMNLRLESLDIEAVAPARIRLIQKAM